MLQYSFENYAVLFLIFSIIITSCNVMQKESSTTDPAPITKQKRDSILNGCSFPSFRLIECKNVADFSNFSRVLMSSSSFDENLFYDISFTDAQRIPASVFEGLKLSCLILDAEGITVDEDVFEGINRLTCLDVRRSSIKDIPDFTFVKTSIRGIYIDVSLLTSLEGKYLQNLTNAQFFSFTRNYISFIDPDVFKGTEKIKTLDLSHNLLIFIPPNLFDSMKHIHTFSASHNNLLHVDNLFSINHPKNIYLEFNNITDADSILHSKMKKVETLLLGGNPIKEISYNTFNGKIPNVELIRIDKCKLREFQWKHFEKLYKLQTLDLSNNLIGKIDGGYKLQRLTSSPILNVFPFVSFDNNQIHYLTDKDFTLVEAIKNLTLQENKIKRIDSNTFRSLRKFLIHLDLSFNLITSLNGSISYLFNLKVLRVTHNLIKTFSEDEFASLDQLSELHLQHNQIKSLGQLHHLLKLRLLNVTDNNIESIRSSQIPKSLRFIYLSDNLIKCDCSNQPFIMWLIEREFLSTDISLCLISELVNNSKSNCPEMCSCGCVYSGNISFMSVDCSSKSLSTLPNFFKNNFFTLEGNVTAMFDYQRSLVMVQNIYPWLHIEDNVLGINLENNSLESLEEVQLPWDIVQLFLANNKLRRLPDSFFTNLLKLKQVSLSGNPWDCDCNTLNLKKWFTSPYINIHDINNTLCGEKNTGDVNLSGAILWTLTDLDICPTWIEKIVLVTFGVLIFLTFCLAAKILYTKYELNFKLFLWSHGFTFVREEDIDHDKQFDAFLSFSHMDDEFVTHEIISVIERKDPNIRLCIHYRDFRAGEFIFDNIMYAVQNSKRTVLILTKNFLESEWCLMEFQTAHIQGLKDKIHRIVVIKVGDLPKEIDPQIEVYLKSTNYLTWGEKYFWNKLLYILPTSSNVRNPVPRNVEDNIII